MLAAYSLRMSDNPMDLVWPISAAARMPDADSADSAGALYATAPTLAASLPKGPGASRENVACDTP